MFWFFQGRFVEANILKGYPAESTALYGWIAMKLIHGFYLFMVVFFFFACGFLTLGMCISYSAVSQDYPVPVRVYNVKSPLDSS